LKSRHQNTGQNHNIKIGNSSFENVANLKYLATAATDQNIIKNEIKISLENSCHHSVQKLCLASKKIKIKIQKEFCLLAHNAV
jgi:hypothetical protein